MNNSSFKHSSFHNTGFNSPSFKISSKGKNKFTINIKSHEEITTKRK